MGSSTYIYAFHLHSNIVSMCTITILGGMASRVHTANPAKLKSKKV
jgi:hypothetical protein